MLQSASAATDLDLISDLKAIPDSRMQRGVRIQPWYFLLVAVLWSLSKCESLRDLERFARRHHGVLTEALGLELKHPPPPLRGSIEPTSGGSFAFIAQVTLYSTALGMAITQACYATRRTMSVLDSSSYSGSWIWTVC